MMEFSGMFIHQRTPKDNNHNSIVGLYTKNNDTNVLVDKQNICMSSSHLILSVKADDAHFLGTSRRKSDV